MVTQRSGAGARPAGDGRLLGGGRRELRRRTIKRSSRADVRSLLITYHISFNNICAGLGAGMLSTCVNLARIWRSFSLASTWAVVKVSPTCSFTFPPRHSHSHLISEPPDGRPVVRRSREIQIEIAISHHDHSRSHIIIDRKLPNSPNHEYQLAASVGAQRIPF